MFRNSPKTPFVSALGAFFISVLVLSGCSSSKITVIEEVVDTPAVTVEKPVLDGYVWVDSTSAVVKSVAGVETNYISSGGKVVYSSGSPDGAAIVFAVESDGRVQLNYVDMARGASRTLQAAREPVIFTGAWSPDSRSFAFGFYTPMEGQGRNTIGAGQIKVYTTSDGQVRVARCSASQAVVAWPEAEMLMVRNNDNMYGVSPADCSTQVTVDIRKWHHITPSPDGSKLAYILRDLAFNPDSRNYEPDSMLYVVDTGAIEGKLVVGERYRPRNVSWAPGSQEIAFDVLERIDAPKRVVFVYQLEEDKRFALNDPSGQNPSESHPAYFDEGSSLTYVAGGERLMMKTGNSLIEQVSVGDEAGPWLRLAGWLAEGEVALVVDASGNVYTYDSRSKESNLLGAGVALVSGGRLR